ncbi:L,D-transpeptidase family protein [Janibacter sp. UYMM211]|uniref:L,D-transpeptidase family protein n=1 Tax=Janibacter sp. UYMM211 TaxID=3156342 RepID=UPI003395CFB8
MVGRAKGERRRATGSAALVAGLVLGLGACAGGGTSDAGGPASQTSTGRSTTAPSASSTSPSSGSTSTSGTSSSSTSPSSTGSSSSAPSSSSSSSTSTPSPSATPRDTSLRPGDSGPRVRSLQRSLTRLGYWGGTADGTYGGLTEQAVLALQKQAGLDRDGVAGPRTLRAVADGTRPTVGAGAPDRVEIDLERQLLYVVRDGSVRWAISTSTGSGETYESSYDGLAVAVTPPGTFAVGRVYDGSEVAKLGTLYRPRYFNGGIAVHGAASVPGWPASHGCARVSDPAMDLIWSQDLMPVGSTVVVR